MSSSNFADSISRVSGRSAGTQTLQLGFEPILSGQTRDVPWESLPRGLHLGGHRSKSHVLHFSIIGTDMVPKFIEVTPPDRVLQRRRVQRVGNVWTRLYVCLEYQV